MIRPSADALLWAAKAPVVKALDDTTALRNSPAATIRVFRKYFPAQDINRNGRSVVVDVLMDLGDAPATHIELFNECCQRLGQGLERYVEFTREAVAFLKTVRPDLTIVAYCFSTGNPEADDWRYLKDHGYGGAEIIGIHEYWGRQGFTGWNALRYRKAREWTGGDHPPFIVTECGRDKVEGGAGGWRADGISPDLYVSELRAYDAEILKDPYVIAATPFTAGPTPDWENFSTDPIAPRLAALAGPLPAPPEDKPMPTLTGIDISNNNGHVDLAAAKAAGYADFVVVKVSEDPSFEDAFAWENLQQAKRLGIPTIFYHFIRPSESAPAASVTRLQDALVHLGGLRQGDGIAIDCEDPNVPDGRDLSTWFAETMALVEQTFQTVPWKYSADYYTSTHALENEAFSKYPTWWASYQETLPAPQVGWGPIRMWQYAVTGVGAVPGVPTRCDLNLFFGTKADLLALGSPLGWGPALTEVVVPVDPIPVPSPDPVPAPLPEVFDIAAARQRLWDEADALDAAGYPWFANGVKSAVAQNKGDR